MRLLQQVIGVLEGEVEEAAGMVAPLHDVLARASAPALVLASAVAPSPTSAAEQTASAFFDVPSGVPGGFGAGGERDGEEADSLAGVCGKIYVYIYLYIYI